MPQLDFKPLPLKFAKVVNRDDQVTAYAAEATDQGLRVQVRLELYDGDPACFDVSIVVTNESAPQKNVYAAVAFSRGGAPSSTPKSTLTVM